MGTSVFVLILNLAKIKFQTGKVLFYDIMCRNGKATYNRNLFVSVFALFVLDRIFSSAFQLGDAKTRLLMAQAIFSCLPFSLILFKFANVKNWAINGMKNDTVDKARFKGIIDKINVNIDKIAVSDSNKSLLLLDFIHLFLKGISIAIVLLILLGYIRLADFIFYRIILFAVFVVLMFALRELIFWFISKLPFAKISTIENSDNYESELDNDDENKQANEAIANFWLKATTDVILLIFAVPIFLYVIGFDWMDVSHWFELSMSGFSIGAITISFENIVSGLSIFFLIIFFTRWLTSSLDKKFEKNK